MRVCRHGSDANEGRPTQRPTTSAPFPRQSVKEKTAGSLGTGRSCRSLAAKPRPASSGSGSNSRGQGKDGEPLKSCEAMKASRCPSRSMNN